MLGNNDSIRVSFVQSIFFLARNDSDRLQIDSLYDATTFSFTTRASYCLKADYLPTELQ